MSWNKLYETNPSVRIIVILLILNLGMTKLFLQDVFEVIQLLHMDIY